MCVYAISHRVCVCDYTALFTRVCEHMRQHVCVERGLGVQLQGLWQGPCIEESACRAHVSFRVPSLHRTLYVRCNPSLASYFAFCAAERDNAALTCVPLTQARITAITYFGPADTCEARARDACACLAS